MPVCVCTVILCVYLCVCVYVCVNIFLSVFLGEPKESLEGLNLIRVLVGLSNNTQLRFESLNVVQSHLDLFDYLVSSLTYI
jgi:hypothetical protein